MIIRDKWQFTMEQKKKKLKVELLLFNNRMLHQFLIEQIKICAQLKKINNGSSIIESEGIIGKKEYYRDSQKQINFLILKDSVFCINLCGFNLYGFLSNIEVFQEIKEIELSIIDGSEFTIETFKQFHALYHVQSFTIKGIKNIIDKRS